MNFTHDEKENIIELYKKNITLKLIAEQYSVSTTTIRENLKLWGVYKNPYPSVNKTFFKIINTEEKAYWLGFIFTDGYIVSSNNEIGVEICEKDIEHLEKLKKSINYTGDIKVYHKQSTFGDQTNARITFSCKDMKNDLINRNITSTKSKDGMFPIVENELFIKDLLRGMFDGDGNISYRIGRTGKMTVTLNYCGTYDVCKKIEQISGFQWSWSERFPERHNNNYQISSGKQFENIKFLKFLYQDSNVYLTRKYNIYMKLIKNRNDLI